MAVALLVLTCLIPAPSSSDWMSLASLTDAVMRVIWGIDAMAPTVSRAVVCLLMLMHGVVSLKLLRDSLQDWVENIRPSELAKPAVGLTWWNGAVG